MFESQYHRLVAQHDLGAIPFAESFIAQCNASETFRTWHRLLDFSSISPDSAFYKFMKKSGPHFPLMIKYLSEKTRKKSFKWQSENQFLFLAHVFSPSPKTYAISLLHSDATFPFVSDAGVERDPIVTIKWQPYIKKGKGVKRQILKHQTSTLDFVRAVNRKPSRTLVQSSLKKKHLRIYLIKTRKNLISTCIVKRLLYESSKHKYNFFTYPLHFKLFK